jgi:hypothetical protein
LVITPVFRNVRKIIVKIEPIPFVSSLRNLGFSYSGHAAFEGFKFNSGLVTTLHAMTIPGSLRNKESAGILHYFSISNDE